MVTLNIMEDVECKHVWNKGWNEYGQPEYWYCEKCGDITLEDPDEE